MHHLLLLHGAIGAKDQLQALSDELKNKYIVHTLNFKGHGSEPIPDKLSIETFAEDVLNYLSLHNIHSINIFGYSMGGYVALYLAKHHPQKINRIFTFATKFLWTPEIASREIAMLDANKISNKFPAFAQQLEKRHYPNDWKLLLEKTSDMMIDLGNNNLLHLHDYKTINHSILIGIGDKDRMVPLEETIEVYKNLPNANFIVFPKTHHLIEKINLERLTREIELFFNN